MIDQGITPGGCCDQRDVAQAPSDAAAGHAPAAPALAPRSREGVRLPETHSGDAARAAPPRREDGDQTPPFVRSPFSRVPVVLFAGFAAASAVSLHHMDRLPALVLIAPGYLVQSWLFVRHRALGGPGYQATMIGVSAMAWTLLALAATRAVRYLLGLLSPRRAA